MLSADTRINNLFGGTKERLGATDDYTPSFLNREKGAELHLLRYFKPRQHGTVNGLIFIVVHPLLMRKYTSISYLKR